MADGELEYAGFWLRVWAALIDTVLVTIVISARTAWARRPVGASIVAMMLAPSNAGGNSRLHSK